MYRVRLEYTAEITAKHRLRWEQTGLVLSITGLLPNPSAFELICQCAVVTN